jgi:hypothetical protein
MSLEVLVRNEGPGKYPIHFLEVASLPPQDQPLLYASLEEGLPRIFLLSYASISQIYHELS